MLRQLTAVTVLGWAVLFAMFANATATVQAGGFSFVVTSAADEVDVSPGDGHCADFAAQCTLRAAVQESNALAGRQTISIPAGEYALIRGGSGENAADLGDLDITDDATIAGAGRNATAIKYGGERIFDVRPGADVTIHDLIVRDVFFQGLLSGGDECGAGIRNAGNLTIAEVDISGNRTRLFGGGVCNDGELRIVDSTISGNQSLVIGAGGGLLNNDGGNAHLERVRIVGNRVDTVGGGGVFNFGTVVVVDSEISGNIATNGPDFGGGGIANVGDLTVTNTTITGNRSEADGIIGRGGGGVSTFDQGSSTIINTTVTANDSEGTPGGGVVSVYPGGQAGTVTLINTIVSGNENGDCVGPISSAGHNLDGDGTCGLAAEGDLSGVDPMLGPLADNGGPTQTHALLEGSPTIDAGGADMCPATDQRGAPRPFDGDGVGGPACDIGAFEFGSAPGRFPAPPSGDVDCNATVEAVDALAVLRHVAGLPPLAACLDLGDVNCDTAINAVDALLILRHVAALPVGLPPGCPPIGPPP